jgi:hypothetical protein
VSTHHVPKKVEGSTPRLNWLAVISPKNNWIVVFFLSFTLFFCITWRLFWDHGTNIKKHVCVSKGNHSTSISQYDLKMTGDSCVGRKVGELKQFKSDLLFESYQESFFFVPFDAVVVVKDGFGHSTSHRVTAYSPSALYSIWNGRKTKMTGLMAWRLLLLNTLFFNDWYVCQVLRASHSRLLWKEVKVIKVDRLTGLVS